LDQTDGHYGGLILHIEVRWLRKGKVLLRFLKLLPEIVLFLQNRSDLPSQLKDSHRLLDLPFLTDLTAETNELNTQFQGEDNIAIEVIGTVEYFEGKL
jgi:hypothetical protein